MGCSVNNGYGEDIRHYVTVGDNKGVNINCAARGNVVLFARSAGIDSHCASFNFIAEGNQITLASGAAAEGITMQGLHNQAINNTIRGVTGIGLNMQPLVDGFTTEGAKNVAGNMARRAVISQVAAQPPVQTPAIAPENPALADWKGGK
jgi:hypothetical protein